MTVRVVMSPRKASPRICMGISLSSEEVRAENDAKHQQTAATSNPRFRKKDNVNALLV